MLRKIEVVAAAEMLGITSASEIAERTGLNRDTVACYQSSLRMSGGDPELARSLINASSNSGQRERYRTDPVYRQRRLEQGRACRQRKKAA